MSGLTGQRMLRVRNEQWRTEEGNFLICRRKGFVDGQRGLAILEIAMMSKYDQTLNLSVGAKVSLLT